jgi:hypothetical protein
MQVDGGATPTQSASLHAQIQALVDLHRRVKGLRQIPSHVLKPPTSTSADGLPLSPRSQRSLRTELEHVKEIGNIILSEGIQDALRSARDSFQVDTKDLNFNVRREDRKRGYVSEVSCFLPRMTNVYRRPPSAESPEPYVAVERRRKSLFPELEAGTEPLRAEGLEAYIGLFNGTSECKMHLWRKTRGTPLTEQPIILRFMVPDVLVAYVSVVSDGVLLSESVTFFGPRERVSMLILLCIC